MLFVLCSIYCFPISRQVVCPSNQFSLVSSQKSQSLAFYKRNMDGETVNYFTLHFQRETFGLPGEIVILELSNTSSDSYFGGKLVLNTRSEGHHWVSSSLWALRVFWSILSVYERTSWRIVYVYIRIWGILAKLFQMMKELVGFQNWSHKPGATSS